ncbi:hypothetical protein WAF17_16925 [Bernardetia sp. ABR2-2B]|uniref:hypothetical protein n=1 Tax=Bernardetia sp. ABR2-2B TaxID=3127472 RepID=UPI0030D28D27
MTDLEKTLKNLESSLKHKRENTLWNHFLTFTERSSSYSGTVNKNGFEVWRYSRWQGAFYTVFIGKVVEREGVKKIALSKKLNKFAKFLITGLFFLFLFTMLNSAINYKQAYDGSHYFWEIKWDEIFNTTLSAIVFFTVMFPVFYYVNRVKEKEEIESLKERFIIYSNSTNQDYF